ncbi:MAG: hypothetical protein ABI769_01305 [Pseudomonadota bacterium]
MLVNLRALLARLLDIVLFRGGPESLPASTTLLAIVIVMNIITGLAVVAITSGAVEFPAMELLVTTLVPLLWYQVAFSMVMKRERFVQTMIAYFGVNMLFAPLLTPVVTALAPYFQPPDPNNPAPAALSLLFLMIGVWVFVVWVRVVRAAFEWPYVGAILFVFAENIVAFYIYLLLFGGSPNKV